MAEPIPLVLVQGFLGSAGLISWDRYIGDIFHSVGHGRKIIVPSLGPVSSLHDRACELYYSLVGGTVDYGEDHSSTHRHSRYGRTFSEGSYPGWSKERPLHFMGHSVGGPTITKLQYLLQQGHFGNDSHPDMVLSVNAVCAPFRGTQLVYTLGESLTAAPQVRPLSIGALLGKLVHILAYLAPILPRSLDVHADARSLAFGETSFIAFLNQLRRSQWAESKDAVPYDMTFEAAETRDNLLEGRVYPNTFYRSHVSLMTRRTNSISNPYEHRPQLALSLTHTLLYLPSTLIGTFDYRLLHPSPLFAPHNIQPLEQNGLSEKINLTVPEVHGEEHMGNDGIVPIFSQYHPSPCPMTACSHIGVRHLNFSQQNIWDPNPRPIRGRWIVETAEGMNHLSLIPGLSKSEYQKAFWTELGMWLHSVDTLTAHNESY